MKRKIKYGFFQVPVSFSKDVNVDIKETVIDMLDKLEEGGKIISAVSTGNIGVQYIIKFYEK